MWPNHWEFELQNKKNLADEIKLFNSIATPILYKVVMTDRFSHFLFESDLPSRTKQLRYTQALFIEYEEESDSLSYDSILRHGYDFLWQLVGSMTEGMEFARMAESQSRMITLNDALGKLQKSGLKRLFPSLTTVAISSIYGRQSDRWVYFEKAQDEFIALASDKLDPRMCGFTLALLLGDSHVKHFCVRDMLGPLSMPPVSTRLLEADLRGPKKYAHLDTILDKFPTQLGRELRLSSDVPMKAGWEALHDDISFCLSEYGKKIVWPPHTPTPYSSTSTSRPIG